MKRYKTIFSALSILLLTAAVQAAPWKIQPGVGVGPVLLGADSKAADAAFNRKEVLNTHGGTGRWINYKEGLELELESGKVLQIVVPEASLSSKQGSLELELEGGIRVGSTVAQMEAALGRGYKAQDLESGQLSGSRDLLCLHQPRNRLYGSPRQDFPNHRLA